jgi:hypothetical protein
LGKDVPTVQDTRAGGPSQPGWAWFAGGARPPFLFVVIVLGGCMGDAPKEWYEVTRFAGSPPIWSDAGETLEGWLEVDGGEEILPGSGTSVAVLRLAVLGAAGASDKDVSYHALTGGFYKIGFPDNHAGLRFQAINPMDSLLPPAASVTSRNAGGNRFIGGFNMHENRWLGDTLRVEMFEAEFKRRRFRHPRVVKSYRLVSVGSDAVPTGLVEGRLFSSGTLGAGAATIEEGVFRRYEDDSWVMIILYRVEGPRWESLELRKQVGYWGKAQVSPDGHLQLAVPFGTGTRDIEAVIRDGRLVVRGSEDLVFLSQ